MSDINDLRQERGKLIADMRSLNDGAIKDSKDLEGELLEKYNAMETRLDSVSDQIKRAERLEAAERENVGNAPPIANQSNDDDAASYEDEAYRKEIENIIAFDFRMAAKHGNLKPTKIAVDRALARCDTSYRGSFWAMQRIGRHRANPGIHNALETGTDSEGGYIVPTEYETVLVKKKKLFNEIRTVATVMTTAADTNIPVESDEGTATWRAEEAAYTESDAVFAQVVLNAYKLGRIIKISEELMQDAFFNLPEYIADAFGRSFGLAEEAAFINGDGSGKPTGIIPSGTIGVTAASQTAITADEVFDLYYALGRPYRAMARWLTSDTHMKNIRKLKDNDGQYLWQPGLQQGEPDRLLGRPIITSTAVPAPAASARSLAFGDMSYYRIADRLGTIMQRLDELYAGNGQVGFRMRSRTDGKLTLAEAVQVLDQAA